jgi:AAT family amino acid transporter
MTEILKPRWGQPATGIISNFAFFLIALLAWYLFSDPRGPVGSFPYPFVLYLAMMILVGLWQHMLLGDWPFQDLPQPMRGIVETIVNLIVVWFVIHIVFYRILGLGFNFLSQVNLETIAAAKGTVMPAGAGATLTYEKLVDPSARYAERAIVTFVLVGFYSYPFVTILFGKWPIRPSDLTQPQAGLAELGWCSLLTLFFYTILIVPFWGMIWGNVFGASYGLNNSPWWGSLSGTKHVHWVFGWWEWMIVILFMTPNVWRMKPWSLIKLPQPWKGAVSFVLNVIAGFVMAIICIEIIPAWINMGDLTHHLPAGDKGDPTRFLWYHTAEIAGFALVPFLAWHHYFDDMVPQKDKDSWGAFWFRTVGVLVLMVITYVIFYHFNFGNWGLGNHHMHGELAERFINGESLIWNFWWIIPLLWDEWFFHKWPFYVHESH